MFTNQAKLAVDDLKGYAKALGMDSGKFDKCLDSGEKKSMVEEDRKAGSAAGVNGTPAFFINGVFINGAQPYDEIKQTVDRELGTTGCRAMRMSRSFRPTLTEVPAEATVASHQLLVRAGYIRQLSAGLYSILPLGQRSILKISAIVREEMNGIGGQEFYLPALNPREI